MTAIRTTAELQPLLLASLVLKKESDWKKAEYEGKVKTDSQGRPLYRGDDLQAMRTDDSGMPVSKLFGKVSITVAVPCELRPGVYYRPVGVYTWNDWDKGRTSIQIERLEEVKL